MITEQNNKENINREHSKSSKQLPAFTYTLKKTIEDVYSKSMKQTLSPRVEKECREIEISDIFRWFLNNIAPVEQHACVHVWNDACRRGVTHGS